MLRDSWKHKTPACIPPSLLSQGMPSRVAEGLLSCFLMDYNLTKARHCLAVPVESWSAHPEREMFNEFDHSFTFWSSVHMSSWGRWGTHIILPFMGWTWMWSISINMEMYSGLGRMFQEKPVLVFFSCFQHICLHCNVTLASSQGHGGQQRPIIRKPSFSQWSCSSICLLLRYLGVFIPITRCFNWCEVSKKTKT